MMENFSPDRCLEARIQPLGSLASLTAERLAEVGIHAVTDMGEGCTGIVCPSCSGSGIIVDQYGRAQARLNCAMNDEITESSSVPDTPFSLEIGGAETPSI